ncbi:unnamed protein product [Parnassius apollo]|uniref:(apollo) hypothetical protein n=1 Tax=Parnassius apollo TaxID=110799 RepID=A0A8S3WFL4_PARAO|nr:unnamed protein product [Parnassius apollo]
MPIIINKSRLHNEKIKQKTKNNSIVIFSDSIGQELASKIIEKTEFQAINNCKPDAGFQNILENYGEKIKGLEKKDTVAVLITKYESSLYHNQQKYIKLLNDIVNQPCRKFNMIITGLRYNGKNDNEIHHINNQILNIAKVSENIKFLDPNMRYKNTRNYKLLKKFIIENTTTSIDRKFQGSSSLRFIKYQNEHTSSSDNGTNFLTTQEPIQKR